MQSLDEIIRRLAPLHKPLGPPEPGDWLAVHDEPGQTFSEYLAQDPVLATPDRRTIVIQPIGHFSGAKNNIPLATAEFLERYFQLPTRIEPAFAVDDSWPASSKRIHPTWGDRQLNAGFILEDVLKPKLPEDAAAYLGLTSWDLWPRPGWNFVFGMASIKARVGVWSIYRNGDPSGGPDAFRRALRRTLRTATHETGHMFSLLHCTAFQCNMCGSNSQKESDRLPLYLCPQCLAKLKWATGADLEKRFSALRDFSVKHGMQPEADFFERSAELTKASRPMTSR